MGFEQWDIMKNKLPLFYITLERWSLTVLAMLLWSLTFQKDAPKDAPGLRVGSWSSREGSVSTGPVNAVFQVWKVES